MEMRMAAGHWAPNSVKLTLEGCSRKAGGGLWKVFLRCADFPRGRLFTLAFWRRYNASRLENRDPQVPPSRALMNRGQWTSFHPAFDAY